MTNKFSAMGRLDEVGEIFPASSPKAERLRRIMEQLSEHNGGAQDSMVDLYPNATQQVTKMAATALPEWMILLGTDDEEELMRLMGQARVPVLMECMLCLGYALAIVDYGLDSAQGLLNALEGDEK